MIKVKLIKKNIFKTRNKNGKIKNNNLIKNILMFRTEKWEIKMKLIEKILTKEEMYQIQ